ncbi:helix-turn-helix domain-containing protein [Streptomyces griseoincarnatus]
MKLLREAAGLTQAQLGERVGYGEAQIAAVEQGRRIPRPELVDAVDREVGGRGGGCHEGGGGEGSVSEPNSSTAGSSVRSRMNSSTNTGAWSSAYVFRACSDRSWYRSSRKRVFSSGP